MLSEYPGSGGSCLDVCVRVLCRQRQERRVDDRVDAPIRPMNRAPSQEWLGGASTGGLRPGGALQHTLNPEP